MLNCLYELFSLEHQVQRITGSNICFTRERAGTGSRWTSTYLKQLHSEIYHSYLNILCSKPINVVTFAFKVYSQRRHILFMQGNNVGGSVQ